MFRLLITVLVAGLALAAVMAWAQRDNAYRLRRAQDIVRELQRLEIGKSDLSVADAIAKRFGNAPVPEGFITYPKEYCASPDRNGNCVYILSMNNSPLESLLLKYHWLPRLGAQDWTGYAEVILADETVSQYSYYVWYRASNGKRRAVGSRVSKMLPKYLPFQASMSDSYSIERIGTGGTEGILLQSSLTPNATTNEWQRASHISFACLGEKRGCGDICEVMPEAWEDFYKKRGRADVEHFGSDYLLCSKPPDQSNGH